MKAVQLALYSVLFAGFAFCDPSIVNFYIFDSNSSTRNAMHDLINDHVALPYASTSNTDVWDAMEVLFSDPSNPDNIILTYSRRSEAKESVDWDLEHLWCNSFGINSIRPMHSDLFNLIPADSNVSSIRGNNFFDDSNISDSNFKEPGFHEANHTSRDNDSWEPPEVVKGDIARAVFYMDLRYEGNAENESDLVLTDDTSIISSSASYFGKLSTLLEWHRLDPVSEEEIFRNELIFEEYQQNRNPFIDLPDLATALYDQENQPLVFLHASYYTENVASDITNIVNSQITDGYIDLRIGNDTLGGDPDFGQVKAFYGMFSYNGKIFEISLEEGDYLSLPENFDSTIDKYYDGETDENYEVWDGDYENWVDYPNWNDADLFYVKSYTQLDGTGSQFRSFDFLAKARDNFDHQTQSLVFTESNQEREITHDQFNLEGAHHVFEKAFEDESSLYAEFPHGTYQWTVTDQASSNFARHEVSSVPSDFPNVQPQIINGEWSDGVLVIDPYNPYIEITTWEDQPDGNLRIEAGTWGNGYAMGMTRSASIRIIDFEYRGYGTGNVYDAYLFYNKVHSERENPDESGEYHNSRFGHVSALYFKFKYEWGDRHPYESGDLEIIEANYGASVYWIDVTSRLQQMVRNNSLIFNVNSYELGGDPAFGHPKELEIEYSYKGDNFLGVYIEGETVFIPNERDSEAEPTLSEILENPSAYGLIPADEIEVALEESWEAGYTVGFIEGSEENITEGYEIIAIDELEIALEEHWDDGYKAGYTAGNEPNESLFEEHFQKGEEQVIVSPTSYGLMKISDMNASFEQIAEDAFEQGLLEGINSVVDEPESFSLFSSVEFNTTLENMYDSAFEEGFNEAVFEISKDPSRYGLIDESVHYRMLKQTSFLPYTPKWFFTTRWGWMYTDLDIYPYFYKSNSASWLYFEPQNGRPNFFDYRNSEWMDIE